MDFEDDIDALYATYQSLLPMAEADSARLWQKFRLDWNYNSNRIEGNTLTRGETKALLEEGIKPIKMRKDILQMQSHDKAIDFLKELAESETPLSEMDIRALHKTALGENYWTEAITAENVITKREIEIGVYKKVPNVVLKSDGSTHEYASPQEVPARMAETVKGLRKYLNKADRPLHDYLAELHQDFIQTHPFDDGNGRVVRLLINYVCLHLNWPPVIIKSEKRSEYIASLESWNDGDERPFRELMKRELIWSLKKSIAAARGEDIEDPDDVSKSIDLFVRDNLPSAISKERTVGEVAEIYKSFVFPVMENLEKNIVKFEKLFRSYSCGLTVSALKRTVSNNNSNAPFSPTLVYHLKDYVGTDSGKNVQVVLKPNFGTFDFDIEIQIRAKSEIKVKNFGLYKNLYGVSNDLDAVDFSNKALKYVLKVIEAYNESKFS